MSYSFSSRTIFLPHHNVPAGQEHAVPLGNDQGAAAGEGKRGVNDGAAAGDAGDSRQAAGAAEAAAGPGAEAAGADAGDRRTEHPPGRTGTQAPRADGQQYGCDRGPGAAQRCRRPLLVRQPRRVVDRGRRV